MAKVLGFQLQHQSFQWIFRTDFLYDWLVWKVQHHSSSALSFLYSPTLTSIQDYWKNHSLTIWTFVSKVMSLLFNMLSRFFIAFLPRSKHLLISWLQSPCAVILEPKKVSLSLFPLFPVYLSWSDGTGCHDLCFWMLSFKPTFSLPSFILIKRLFSSSHFLPLGWYHLHIWGCCCFPGLSWFQLVFHPAQRFTWCTYSASKLNKQNKYICLRKHIFFI